MILHCLRLRLLLLYIITLISVFISLFFHFCIFFLGFFDKLKNATPIFAHICFLFDLFFFSLLVYVNFCVGSFCFQFLSSAGVLVLCVFHIDELSRSLALVYVFIFFCFSRSQWLFSAVVWFVFHFIIFSVFFRVLQNDWFSCFFISRVVFYSFLPVWFDTFSFPSLIWSFPLTQMSSIV